MKTATTRVIVLLLAFALVAAACGDDDATTTQATTAATDAPASTEAPETTEAPAATTTTAAPATTQAAAPTPESVIADNMVPLPPNTELVSLEEIDGGFRVGAIVNSAPPPNYAATLAGTDWEVLDVVFGSETTVATYLTASICLIAYANYDGATDPSFWFYFWIFTGGLTAEDCLNAVADVISFSGSLGRPS